MKTADITGTENRFPYSGLIEQIENRNPHRLLIPREEVVTKCLVIATAPGGSSNMGLEHHQADGRMAARPTIDVIIVKPDRFDVIKSLVHLWRSKGGYLRPSVIILRFCYSQRHYPNQSVIVNRLRRRSMPIHHGVSPSSAISSGRAIISSGFRIV